MNSPSVNRGQDGGYFAFDCGTRQMASDLSIAFHTPGLAYYFLKSKDIGRQLLEKLAMLNAWPLRNPM